MNIYLNVEFDHQITLSTAGFLIGSVCNDDDDDENRIDVFSFCSVTSSNINHIINSIPIGQSLNIVAFYFPQLNDKNKGNRLNFCFVIIFCLSNGPSNSYFESMDKCFKQI
jgi:hypothetical protein